MTDDSKERKTTLGVVDETEYDLQPPVQSANSDRTKDPPYIDDSRHGPSTLIVIINVRRDPQATTSTTPYDI